MCLLCLCKMNSEDGQVYSVCILHFSCFTTVCSQNINKQNVNIADETHTDYSFLSRYHYTKSKNYSKRRYRIRHWIPMFIGSLCSRAKLLYNKINNRKILLISSFAVSGRNENKLSFVYVSPKIAVHFTVV